MTPELSSEWKSRAEAFDQRFAVLEAELRSLRQERDEARARLRVARNDPESRGSSSRDERTSDTESPDAKELAPGLIVVAGGDVSGIRDAVGRILSRRGLSLVTALDLAPGPDEMVRLMGADARAPAVVLRADHGPLPGPWPTPKSRTVHPTPGRSAWRKRTRRANSHGQRRS